MTTLRNKYIMITSLCCVCQGIPNKIKYKYFKVAFYIVVVFCMKICTDSPVAADIDNPMIRELEFYAGLWLKSHVAHQRNFGALFVLNNNNNTTWSRQFRLSWTSIPTTYLTLKSAFELQRSDGNHSVKIMIAATFN